MTTALNRRSEYRNDGNQWITKQRNMALMELLREIDEAGGVSGVRIRSRWVWTVGGETVTISVNELLRRGLLRSAHIGSRAIATARSRK